MAIKKKTTTKKKKPSVKKGLAKLKKANDTTFNLTWKDQDGEERCMPIGTMVWSCISYEDAAALEKLVGKTILDYFNKLIKKNKKGQKKNAK